MARIPFALANQAVPAAPGAPGLSLASAMAPGAALMEAGADLQRSMERIQEKNRIAAEKAQRLADANGITQAISAGQRGLAERFDAFSQANDATAPDFTARWTKDAESFIAGVISNTVGEGDNRRLSVEAEAELKSRLEGYSLAYWEKSRGTQRQAQGKAAQDVWDVFGRQQAALVTRAPDALATSLEAIEDMVARYTGAEGVSEDALRDARRATRESTIVAAVQGALDLRDVKVARLILNNTAYDADLDAGKRGALNNAIEATERQIKAERAAAAREWKADLRSHWENARDRFTDGFSTDPNELLRLKESFTAVGDEARAAEVAAVMQTQGTLEELQKGTPVQVQQFVNDLYSQIAEQGGSPTQAQQFTLRAAEKLSATMERMVIADPLSLAARTGVTNVPPLVFEGDTAAASIEARIAVAVGTADFYGLGTPKYLTQAERVQATALLNDPDPDRVLAVLSTINKAFGHRANQVMAEISEEDRAAAHIGGLSNMGPEQLATAARAIKGKKIAAGGTKIAIDETLAREVEVDVTGGALRNLSNTRAAGLQTARLLYIEEMTRLGRAGDVFDEKVYAGVLELAFGGTKVDDGRRGGFGRGLDDETIVLPVDMSEYEFLELLDHLTDEDLVVGSVGGGIPTFENGETLTAEELRDHGRLEDMGDGRYRVMSTITDRYLQGTGDGGWYELDVSAIAPRVKARKKE